MPDLLASTVEPLGAGRLLWAFVATVAACIPLGLSLWAFLDAARRPQWAWALSRHRQVVWMLLVPFGVLTVVGGLAISTWYLVRVRPAVARAERGDLGRVPPPTAGTPG